MPEETLRVNCMSIDIFTGLMVDSLKSHCK
jgi:hypothetical protein